jgi:hypothetical protein
MPELMVQMARVCGSPRVAKAVQHVPEQHREIGTVQPVTIKPSVGSEGGVGVVVYLSKTKEKYINISFIEQRQPPTQYNSNEKSKFKFTLLTYSVSGRQSVILIYGN